MEPALSARGVEMEFGSNGTRTRVLHGVDLDIAFGKLTMLVGPSGCGKTTLLSIVSGTLRPTKGDVDVMNARITAMRDGEKVKFRRNRIGFIFQQYNLLPALTAAENAATPLVAAGMPLDKAAARARTVLADLGMGPHTDKLPRQLSGGQQQRVAIARALVGRPRLLLLDEPFSSLDPDLRAVLREEVQRLHRSLHLTSVYVTHDREDAAVLADRVIEMRQGRTVVDRDVSRERHA